MDQKKHRRRPAVLRPDQEASRRKLLEHYSEAAADHMLRPRNMRRISSPDGYARTSSADGESLEFFLELAHSLVVDCAFQSDGCAATQACASAATELALNKSLAEALSAVSARALVKALGGLPEGNLHCAHFVVEAFRRSAVDALDQQSQPWKKVYRKT